MAMTTTELSAIPDARRDAVHEALTATFGAAPIRDLAPLTGGVSALTFRMEVAGRPYVLRLDKQGPGLSDPRRAYPCMAIAAEADLAPALHHADPEAAIAIMDFIPQRPLSEHPGGPVAVARALGDLTARVQATPIFPALGDYRIIVERLLGLIRGSGMFAPGLLDAHLEGFERIREVYAWRPEALVSSHNDPNPRNILYDGERLWLIDWELSFRNDPLADIAILAGDFAATPELETALMSAWLGRAPDAALRARFTLMRQLTRLFYGCLILTTFLGVAREAPDSDLAAPSVAELHRAVQEGRLSPAQPSTIYLIGKMHLAGFLAGLQAPEFEPALRLARDG
jgi:aminoglycoside phosphotransferase (APT) family kinase protein